MAKPQSRIEIIREIELLREFRRRGTETHRCYVPYAPQLEFHTRGKDYNERGFFAGNQLGKTLSAAHEAFYHASGLYPEWWPGARFTKANTGWIGGDIREAVPKMLQQINADFDKMPLTIGRAMTMLSNAFGKIVNGSNQAGGATGKIAAVIKEFVSYLDTHGQQIEDFVVKIIDMGTQVAKTAWEWKGFIAGFVGISVVTNILVNLVNTFVKLGGIKIVSWGASVVTTLKGVNIAALTLKGTIGALSGVFLAWTAGWEIGTLLNKFGVVQKWMTGLIHTADLLQLSARRMWRALTGGDTDEIDRNIAIAKQAYDERLKEIDQEVAGKQTGNKKAPKDESLPEPTPAPENKPSPVVSQQERDAIDTWPEDWLTPEQLEARNKKKAAITDKTAEQKPDDDKKLTEAEIKKKYDDDLDAQKREADRQEEESNRKKEQAKRKLIAFGDKNKASLDSFASEDERGQKALEDTDSQAFKDKQNKQADARQLKREKQAEYSRQQEEALAQVQEERADNAVKQEEEMAQAQAKRVEDAKQKEQEWAASQAAAVDKAKSVFQKYADKVKSLQDDIAGREKSLTSELDGLDNRGTVESRWRQKVKAAKEYEKAAKAAMKAGDLEKALSLSDQAKESYSSLKGGAGNISDKLGNQAAYQGVKESGQLGIEIAKAIQQAT